MFNSEYVLFYLSTSGNDEKKNQRLFYVDVYVNLSYEYNTN